MSMMLLTSPCHSPLDKGPEEPVSPIRNNPVFVPSSQYTETRLKGIPREPCYTATGNYAIRSATRSMLRDEVEERGAVSTRQFRIAYIHCELISKPRIYSYAAQQKPCLSSTRLPLCKYTMVSSVGIKLPASIGLQCYGHHVPSVLSSVNISLECKQFAVNMINKPIARLPRTPAVRSLTLGHQQHSPAGDSAQTASVRSAHFSEQYTYL